LKAIACNRHTRLLEIQRELSKNVQISQSPTDVVLKREVVHVDSLGKKVRVFGHVVFQAIRHVLFAVYFTHKAKGWP
jgi:hypothetical protein